jgi:hypothetical protein
MVAAGATVAGAAAFQLPILGFGRAAAGAVPAPADRAAPSRHAAAVRAKVRPKVVVKIRYADEIVHRRVAAVTTASAPTAPGPATTAPTTTAPTTTAPTITAPTTSTTSTTESTTTTTSTSTTSTTIAGSGDDQAEPGDGHDTEPPEPEPGVAAPGDDPTSDR